MTLLMYICYKDTVFQPSDFDMLIAVRTAPHHSWCNHAERIMSKADELEDEFETLKTLEDISEKSKDNPNLKAELQNALQQ
ncbi:hypothetical protein RirG_266180 [Rhizophagus irregularis DAOM 197198w]|uniref:Uncharacterized protein n=1 Tax=Rhizophagus irregularis (strain DAOM 197198w) TaxID=1432141 RepID=A0A015JUY7_RHIIW|nr:hypothetical protein RirG_266180 [Rhizophagus irregularis DAOM 197198w]